VSIAFRYRDAITRGRPRNFGSIRAIKVTPERAFGSYVKRHGKAVERRELEVSECSGIHG